jgi:hypothetical protein
MSGPRILGAVFALLMLGLAGSPLARAGSTAAQACASHDLIVLSLIEKHGEAQSLPAQLVADAAMKLLSARAACRDGREAEAIAIYTDLDARLTAAAGSR